MIHVSCAAAAEERKKVREMGRRRTQKQFFPPLSPSFSRSGAVAFSGEDATVLQSNSTPPSFFECLLFFLFSLQCVAGN